MEQEEPNFILNYKGKDLDCDKATGRVINRDQLEFESDCVVKFTGGTEDPDWKDLKVSPDSAHNALAIGLLTRA